MSRSAQNETSVAPPWAKRTRSKSPGVGFEQGDPPAASLGEAKRHGTRRPRPNLEDAQRNPVDLDRGHGFEPLLEGAGGRSGGRRPEIIAFNGAVRRTFHLRRARRKRAQRLACAGRKQEFRRTLGMLRGDRGKNGLRGRQIEIVQPQDAARAFQQAAPFKLRQKQLGPNAAALRQAAGRNEQVEIDHAFGREVARKLEGGGGRPTLEHQRDFGKIGRRARWLSAGRPDFERRAAREVEGGGDPTRGEGEIGKPGRRARSRRLAAHAEDSRRRPRLPVEDFEVGDQDSIVEPPQPDSGACDVRIRQKKARFAEADRQIGAAFAVACGEQKDKPVKTGIEAGRVEAVARVARSVGQLDLDEVVAHANSLRKPLESWPEVEASRPRPRINLLAGHGAGARCGSGTEFRRRPGFLDDPPARVEGERRLGQARSAENFDGRRRSLDPAQDLARNVGGERKRLLDFEVPERHIRPSPIPRHREPHFQERRAGQKGLAVDAVIGERRLGLRIHDRPPFERSVGLARAGQGVPRPRAQLAARLGRFRESVGRAAPGIGRQRDARTGVRAESPMLANLGAARDQAHRRRLERIAAFGVAFVQHAIDERGGVEMLGGVAQMGLQRRPRPDLEKHPLAGAERAFDALLELDDLAHVAPPIGGAGRGALDEFASHGRQEGNRAR